MPRLRVVLAQIPVVDDVATNVKTITSAVAYTAAEGADILLTPEGSLSGYRADFDIDEVREAMLEVERAAREAGIGLALGTCMVEADGSCYDQLRFYAPNGAFLGFHAKVLRCGSWDVPPVGEITAFQSVPLRTFEFPALRIAGLICNDLWANPGYTPLPDTHLSQELAGMGARVIFHAVNGDRDGSEFSQRVCRNFHESNLLMRAKAGNLVIATVDNCHPRHLLTSSPGGVVGPTGEWLFRLADRGEQLGAFTIDL